jgi:hypothetical protein
MSLVSDLVRIWATGDIFEGEMMRGRLETEGLHVLLKGDGEGPYRAGPVYLFVPREQEEAAREVIDAIASGAFAANVDDANEALIDPDGTEAEPRAT